jgi:hypothetical protein
MLERSKRAVDIRGDLDSVQFIPSDLSCGLAIEALPFRLRQRTLGGVQRKRGSPATGGNGASLVSLGNNDWGGLQSCGGCAECIAIIQIAFSYARDKGRLSKVEKCQVSKRPEALGKTLPWSE